MKKFSSVIFIFSWFVSVQGQLTESNYRIYSVKLTKEVNLKDIAEEMEYYDVLFFGEEHNDSVTHYLEQAMLEHLYSKFGNNIALSMEMFDREGQIVMDEYLKGYIREKNFTKEARVWNNYRDYRPMVEFAKDKKLDIVCANAPSRYTNLAGRKGQKALLELSSESRKYYAPLPYDTASGGYYDKLMGLTQHTPSTKSNDSSKPKAAEIQVTDTVKPKAAMMPPMQFDLIAAQSLWDATMAYSISEYQKNNKKKKILQVNGKFHSDEGFAVVTQLKKYRPKLKSLIISTASDEAFPNIDWTEYKKFGDYIIITDPKVPRTFKTGF